MDPPTPQFPLNLGLDTLGTDTLASGSPERLDGFLLSQAAVLVNQAGRFPHGLLLLQFHSRSNGTPYYVIAERRPRTHTGEEDSTPNFIIPSSNASSNASNAIIGTPCIDAVLRVPSPSIFHPSWWKAAGSEARLAKDLSIPTLPGQLTLLDVALVLHSVTMTSPSYSFLSTNCWWFVSCASLMLHILARTPRDGDVLGVLGADLRREIEGTFFEGFPGPVALWGTFDSSAIKEDVVIVEKTYRSLVSLIHVSHHPVKFSK
jgi:hypothetical protein